ncbi:hypothetical protein HGB13_01940 [bacterium]|nr:hypothetical protein [bacterium]
MKKSNKVKECYDVYMTIKQEQQLEILVEEYNKLFNVPGDKANKIICEQYRKEHPNEFRGEGWSIFKHRKRLMDWLSRQDQDTIDSLSE